MFSGLRSRWTMPLACAWESPMQTCRAIAITRAGDIGVAPTRRTIGRAAREILVIDRAALRAAPHRFLRFGCTPRHRFYVTTLQRASRHAPFVHPTCSQSFHRDRGERLLQQWSNAREADDASLLR